MFTRISKGWNIAMNALRVLNANKQLMVFPILSGITLLAVIGSFFASVFYTSGFDAIATDNQMYPILFLFYLVAYFVIVFFNMALIHCTTLYFRGEEASVSTGLSFSLSRIGLILMWAIFSATIGTILKAIQDNLGTIGKIIVGILGFAWSAATFFVIPVIAYEKLTPIDATKKSIELMKEKWGEAVVANFSFSGLVLLSFLIIGIVAIAVSELVNEGLGIGLFVGGMGLVAIMTSAVRSIIVSAAYHVVDGDMDVRFNKQLLEDLFAQK